MELKNKRNAHNELQIMHQSSYFDHTKFQLFAERNKTNFTILSSNIQSITGLYSNASAFALASANAAFAFALAFECPEVGAFAFALAFES